MDAPHPFDVLRSGTVIPAHPLALTAARKLDERRQRALTRYYVAAGAGGVAVGVHTTQFAVRDPSHGLLEPVLSLAREELDRADAARTQPLVRVAGICGRTAQAVREAALARDLGYHLGLVSLAAMRDADTGELIAHCRAVGEALPVCGFYLQTAVGGPVLSHDFWRRLVELPSLAAVKIAPFNRYRTLDVMRAAASSGRADIALYTGNDDNIVFDLLTPYRFRTDDLAEPVERRIVGGLLGHWAVWTHRAVELLRDCHAAVRAGDGVPLELSRRAVEVTDSNAAFFDAANNFRGCIAGLHEVLRRQGILENILCLDPAESLGPGQLAEIDRVYRVYPHLNDDEFVERRRDEWLSG